MKTRIQTKEMKKKLKAKLTKWFSSPSFFLIFLLILLAPSTLISPKAFIRSLYPFLILAAIINSRRALVVLLAPFVILAPAAIFFWHHFHAPPNATLWLILKGTNVTEFLDFSRSYSFPLVVIMALMTIFVIRIFKVTEGPFFRDSRWRWASALLLIVPIQTLIKADTVDEIENRLGHHYSYSYPWNLVMSYELAQMELRKYESIQLQNAGEPVDVSQDLRPETVVLVIGESARRDRHALYGYKSMTNPLLSQQQNVVKAENAITLHPHTIASVPVILTGVDVAKGVEVVPWSIVQYFKQAGFKTYWFSNQASLGDEDSLLGYYGKSSEVSEFLQVHSHSLPWAHDGALLPFFKKAMSESVPRRKKFIVLHLQGSHYGFKRRYPDSFEVFPDAYDNTVLYTDYILNEMIEDLKKQNGVLSTLVYVSDHGLLLNECGKEFSHFDSKESYEIPYLFWFSDLNSRLPKNSPFWMNLKRPSTTQSVVYTTLDLAGIHVRGQNADHHSLFRRTFNEDVRFVQTYSKSVDYDRSANSETCHLEPLRN